MPASIEHPRWADMQGLVLSAYPHMDRAQYLIFTVRDAAAARRWLARLLEEKRFTPAIKHRSAGADGPSPMLHGGEAHGNVNVALTAEGLVALCGNSASGSLDDLAGQLRGFSYPFVEGIAGRAHRSRILGNTGDSAPDTWEWGGPDTPVHVLLMLFAPTDDGLRRLIADASPPAQAMIERTPRLPATLSIKEAERREHFGFTDGISQPILAGTPDAERFPDSPHLTALGEFVLGYADQINSNTAPPPLGRCDNFGDDGSYLVLAQYEQDVEGFWQFMDDATCARGAVETGAAECLAEKIVGRRRDGTALVPYVNREDNDFDFSEDPFGYGCPLGSHVRRSNPRDFSAGSANRHRILRRGRSYGPRVPDREPTTAKRGLFFMCLNADIERQFEFIQQNWTNNPGFAGLSHERDPLVGDHTAAAIGRPVFTVPSLPAPARIDGLPRFVRVRGAQYFFLPGIDGLRSLAEGRCGNREA
jgi:Dyp-type peroxidase family